MKTETILPAIALVPLLLATGGTRDRLEILERNVGNLQEEMVEVRQQQTDILLELEKMNQRLGADRGGGLADIATRQEGMDEDLRVLFENLNDVDARIRRLSERLDLVLENLYRPQTPSPAGAVPGVYQPDAVPGVYPPGGAGPSTPPMNGEYPNGEPGEDEGGPVPPGIEPSQTAPEGAPGTGQPGLPGQPPGMPGQQPGAPGQTPGTATQAGGYAPPAGGYAQPGQPAPGIVVDPEELYQTSYTDFARGNYELAILGFQDYVKRFPDTDLADNAQYWIGECHYSLERYPQAVAAFSEVEARYAQADKVPDALLKKGYALIEMNQMEQGIRELQKLISNYPRSNAARIARQRLRSMGLSTP